MFGRVRSTARQKLQRAMAEVVRESDRRSRELQENQHDRLLAEMSASNAELTRVLTELSQARTEIAAVKELLAELEQRKRRDISYALDIKATDESAAFVLEHMPKAPVYWDPHDTLRHALHRVQIPGMALEFGVADGTTLRIIVKALASSGGASSDDNRRDVFGFDVFSGLPEAWRTGFPEGEFAQDTLPKVPGAQLVPGLFEDTLPGFLAAHPEPVAFLHLDADLYSSTKTVLDLLGDRLKPGSVIVFDEFFNYPGWQEHEHRAWTEFVARTGLRFDYIGYTANNEQVVVRIG